MKKIITVLLTFLFLTNCGYTPIYSNKNSNFNIQKIITLKNDQLHYKVQRRLQRFSNQESQKIIFLKIDIKKQRNTIAKNSRGNPSRYEMLVNIKVEIEYDETKIINQSFEEKFNYNISSNKFDLGRYEKEIEELLIDKNIDRIVVYLSTV